MKTAAPLTAAIIVTVLAACASRPQAPQGEQEPVTQTATARAASSTDVRTFAIGEYKAIALRDGTGSFPNDNKVFAVGRTPAEVAEVLSAARLPTDKLDLSVQPLLVQTADRVLLFDTGVGSYMGGFGGKLPAALETAGISPASITDIFISHVHGDHVGGLVNASGAAAFPGATIHISGPEWAFFKGLPAQLAAAFGITNHAALVAVMTPQVAEFTPDADIVPGVVKAVAIQGHTPGHSAYRITSGKSSLLYIGDTAHHSVVSVRRPDWTIAFDADAPTAQASRKALLTESAANKQLLYSPHFPFPGLGRIERRGDDFVWVAQ